MVLSKEIKEAYENKGVVGLEQLGLSDSEIIAKLGRYCIGRPDITKTLYDAGWSLDRFLEAEKNFGCSKETLQELRIEYEVLQKYFPKPSRFCPNMI